MIQAIATQIGPVLRLEISDPDSSQVIFKNVATAAEGLRLLHFMNRDYIYKKLTGWLKQRMYGAGPLRTQEGAKLLVMLGYYQHLSLRKLCKVIHNNRSAFETVAPGSRSRFLNHYNTRIIPVLNYCTEIGGTD